VKGRERATKEKMIVKRLFLLKQDIFHGWYAGKYAGTQKSTQIYTDT